MRERQINLSIPNSLYIKCLKLIDEGYFSDLSDIIKAGVRNELKDFDILLKRSYKNISWEEGVEKIRQKIKAKGGIKETDEEILKSLRQIREEIWNKEYSQKYAHSSG